MVERKCAFCGAKESDGDGCLIGAPDGINAVDINICDRCVEKCYFLVMDDKRRKGVISNAPV